jgi:two-component system response regulator
MQTAIDVLLIDDSDAQAQRTLTGVRRAFATASVFRLKDGAQALQYIYRTGLFQDRSRTLPGMIIIDVDIPFANGLQVLERLRDDPDTREIPVVVLTSNRNPLAIEDAYARGARAYFVKPEDSGEYVAEVARLVKQWLHKPTDGTRVVVEPVR